MLMPNLVWIGRVDEYLSLLPAQVAASVLESFYNVVIDSEAQMDSAAAREQLHHHMGELGVGVLLGDKNSTCKTSFESIPSY